MSDRLSLSRLIRPMLQPETELSPQLNFGEITMSRFEKLTHVLWHCQYHIVWVPKYRYRVLTGDVAREVHNCIQVYSSRLGCRVIELNVQPDHVHLLVKVPPKVSISKLLGVVKGKTALRHCGFSRNFRTYGTNHIGAIISGRKVTALIQ